ncbi:glycosyltransferase [Hufsiella ginkgonis]|uniref:Glycosyltransferase n=1 Tax=Hufsiella ginkgonis TaxID=2695274 RepID=A0A7K1Y2I9_9SPHI|nr:glycosyltransferase [Hufsiella ginkgonis]MXV17461.1 glycosyltransferase [Hufsiella ginkgonis]
MDPHLNPLVSIVMPAYNAAAFIESAIESVIRQSWPNWELLIINDGSTDETAAIATRYASADARVKLITQENKRLGGARNTGLRAAAGQWIAFLDADDLWVPVKLGRQLEAGRLHPEADVIYSGGWTFYNGDINNCEPYPTIAGLFGAAEMYRLQYQWNYIPVLSVIFKRELLQRIGLQEEVIQCCEDWDYWLRMARAGACFLGMEDRLFYYRRHDSNMSGNQLNMRLAQASIFLKNFDPAAFSGAACRQIFEPLIHPLIIDLLAAGRKQDAVYIYTRQQETFPSAVNFIHYRLITLIGKRWYPLVTAVSRPKFFFKMRYLRLFGKTPAGPHAMVFQNNPGVTLGASFNIGKSRNVKLFGDEFKLVIGNNVEMREFCSIHIQDKGTLTIGDRVFFNNYCSINCLSEITIGSGCQFGEGVKIYDHNHAYSRPDPALLQERLFVEKDKFTLGSVKIGKNCWIGSNVTILKGVEIGDNVIVGANCLVYRSVPSNSVVKHAETIIIDRL